MSDNFKSLLITFVGVFSLFFLFLYFGIRPIEQRKHAFEMRCDSAGGTPIQPYRSKDIVCVSNSAVILFPVERAAN